MATHYCIGSLR